MGVLSRHLGHRGGPARRRHDAHRGRRRVHLPPGEPHQFVNDGTEDLVIYVVADNPIGESAYFPDSNKWRVQSPHRCSLRSEPLDYFDGEE